MKLSAVIEELVEEKGLEKAVLRDIICEGIKAAYIKKYPHLVFETDYDPKTDELTIKTQKKVVASVVDEETEISQRKARAFSPKAELDSLVSIPFEGKIGRIEILKAKQFIASKIRSIEAEAIYKEFKDKKGTVVYGITHKCEYGGATVKLDDTMAFLPKSLSVPGQKCLVGFPMRALLKDVLKEPKHDNQLILDRASAEFAQRLFELEIPEIFEKIVEIKKIVRTPGYKTKIIVVSHDKNIDPVGTCVGVGGVRIKPILKELGGEKIDIISSTESPEGLIADALKPAEIQRVELVGKDRAIVWLADDQRSLAIGKLGQNIALASQLVGIDIQLAPAAAETAGQMQPEQIQESDMIVEQDFAND